MKVKELIQKLSVIPEETEFPILILAKKSDSDKKIYVRTYGVEILNVHSGFDWDKGFIYLIPEKTLKVTDDITQLVAANHAELTKKDILTKEDVDEIKSWSGYYMVESGMEEDVPRVEKIKAKLDKLLEMLK